MTVRSLLLTCLLLAPCGGLAVGLPPSPAPAPDPAAEARSITKQVRREALIRRLADCETRGRGDGGHGPYVGAFQFEPRTVVAFVRERDGRALSGPEAIALARDYGRASALVGYVIFDRGGHSHWPGCSAKLGIARQVAAIKAL